MPTDLWMRQPKTYMQEALDAGFTKFTWHLAAALDQKIDVLSWIRSAAIGYGDVRVMIVDYSGAAEYSVYDSYDKPTAVYPTWAGDEDFETLIWLVENNVGMDRTMTDDMKVQSDMRPVYGQKHRVVVHRLGERSPMRDGLLLRIRDLQMMHPECEIFISSPLDYNALFGMGWKAVDAMPGNVTASGAIMKGIYLPTGKSLSSGYEFDRRYADWFSLIGWHQSMLTDGRKYLQYNLDAIQWAARNWELATPFVQTKVKSLGTRKVYRPEDYMEVPDTEFILPIDRRIIMRNLGRLNIKPTELDKFMCDTCLLHNACKLYRQGSVCAVKGSEGVELSKYFGTRNASTIIDGLDKLLKAQVERVEDRLEAEKTSGEMDPELTKEINSVMANGTKLAKLIDPTLAGGPKVQVNVGVGGGGQAHVAVAAADPKQLMAEIVRTLEVEHGIPRDQITSQHIKGILEGMAARDPQKALEAGKIINGTTA